MIHDAETIKLISELECKLLWQEQIVDQTYLF